MQKKILLFAAIAVLVIGGAAILQSRKADEAKAQAEAARQKAEADAKKLAEQQQTIERLQKQKSSLSKQYQAALAKNSSAPEVSNNSKSDADSAATNAQSSSKNNAGFLARMLKDPNMRNMMREQQKVMLKTMYDPLFKEMNLSPEDSDKLMTMMLDNQMSGMEKGMALLNGDADKETLRKEVAEDKKAYEAQLKEFLGDERYAQYDDFQKSLPDRMQMKQLKSQFSDNPLTEDQSGQLLAMMKEERKRATAENPTDATKDFSTVLSEESMNKYLEQQEQINSRVLERASQILSPEQAEILGRSLTNQLAMQKMGMNMARSMFGGDKSNAASDTK
jgi:hypothetical protein